MSETIQEPEKIKLIAHEIERYDIKQETKVLKALSGIFMEEKCLVSEDEIINSDDIMAVDQAHVCMAIAKTSRAKICLRRFYNPDVSHKEPCLEAMGINKPYGGDSAYSTDYFVNIMKVVQACDDHFHIRLGHDTPCIIETEDFRFLLAPRIESE